jgi:hypothetical protein
MVEVPTAKPFNFDTATGHERLAELARALDHEEEWRSKIEWDYNVVEMETRCGTAGCAIGLARALWGSNPHATSFETFGILEREASEIFYGYHRSYPADPLDVDNCDFDAVTPGMVANAIRDVLSRYEVAS